MATTARSLHVCTVIFFHNDVCVSVSHIQCSCRWTNWERFVVFSYLISTCLYDVFSVGKTHTMMGYSVKGIKAAVSDDSPSHDTGSRPERHMWTDHSEMGIIPRLVLSVFMVGDFWRFIQHKTKTCTHRVLRSLHEEWNSLCKYRM